MFRDFGPDDCTWIIKEFVAPITIEFESYISKRLGKDMKGCQEVRLWKSVLINGELHRVEPFRAGLNAKDELKAFVLEVQLPSGKSNNADDAIVNCFAREFGGKYANSYHQRIQRVVLTSPTKSKTFKGKFLVPFKTEVIQKELLSHYPANLRMTNKGFCVALPLHLRKEA